MIETTDHRSYLGHFFEHFSSKIAQTANHAWHLSGKLLVIVDFFQLHAAKGHAEAARHLQIETTSTVASLLNRELERRFDVLNEIALEASPAM